MCTRMQVRAALLVSSMQAGLLILAACGGGGQTDPPPPPETPIPEKVYVASLTPVSNTCGATGVTGFDFSFLPQQAGTRISNVFAQPIPAEFSDDVLNFNTVIPVGDSLEFAFGALWTFAEDRNTFQGQTTIDVTYQQNLHCLYTYASSGSLAPEVSSETPPDPQQPSTAAVSRLSTAIDALVYGAVYKPAEPGQTGQVHSDFGVICDVPVGALPRTVIAPAMQFTDVDHSMFGQILAGRVMRTTVYLLRWSPEQQAWVTDDTRSNRDVAVYPRYAVSVPGSPVITQGDYVWSNIEGIIFLASAPGYYTIWTKHEWVVALGAYVLGTVWQYYPGSTDYFTSVAGSGVTAGAGWCHIPN